MGRARRLSRSCCRRRSGRFCWAEAGGGRQRWRREHGLCCGAAEGGPIGQAAANLGVSRDMVSKWRSRFLIERLEGLSDEPRPGRPRLITDDRVEQMITKNS
ncbi:helix-turn-helix domain-containing protein [Amycolatopsis nivea]|uniref:helix-turn-helix domain-containing protein n=1 Tax=Amycolatopsis nivea TaxID=1644109 RepID=UPI0034DE51E6